MFAVCGVRGVPLPPRRRRCPGRTAAGVLVLFGLGAALEGAHVVLPALAAADGLLVEPRLLVQGHPRELEAVRADGARRGRRASQSSGPDHPRGQTAGFGMKDLTWYQYLFTQFRALFVYLGTVRAAGASDRRLGLPLLADAPRPRRDRRTRWPGSRWSRRRGSVSAAVPAGVVRLLRVPAADGADLVHPAHQGSDRGAPPVHCRCSGCC